MLNKIRLFFDNLKLKNELTEQDKTHALQLSVAVLLVEMTRMDGKVSKSELAELERLLNQQFQLETSEIKELLNLANDKLAESTDYYQFTSIINQHFDQAKKSLIIENLWQIAFSDDELNAHEEHFLRKINSLLHISHTEFIRSKLKIQE